MKAIKPVVLSSLIIGALSATQMDAFAAGHPHGHGGGDFVPKEIKRPDNSRDTKRPEGSKYHTVLNHSADEDTKSSPAARSDLQAKGPEEITVDSGAAPAVTVDGIGATGVTVGGMGQAAVTVGGNGLGATVGTGVLGVVHEDDVTAAHPESKTQQNNKKRSASDACYSDPYAC